MKLILCTTSIIRGDFHRKTIGKIYNLFKTSLELFEIHHIINIDSPLQLQKIFSKEVTRTLFQEIIPSFVNTHFIETDTPSFTQGYINTLSKIKELDLLDTDSIVWWLEDDWMPLDNSIDFLKLTTLLTIPNASIMISSNSPLGSFRGGPIMSSSYFKNMFDIHDKGITPQKDPEFQVRKWAGGINRSICRDLTHPDNGIIYVVCIYILSHFNGEITMNECSPWHYKNKLGLSIKKPTKIIFVSGIMDCVDSDKIYYNIFSHHSFICPKSIAETKRCAPRCSIGEFKNLFQNQSITHINIVPHILEDKGRVFNTENNLKKWTDVEHNTTYL